MQPAQCAEGIYVLRIGHRAWRDKRVTTHVALSSMALGASGIFLSGEEDSSLIQSVTRARDRWAPHFSVDYSRSWRDVVGRARSMGCTIVHLTMYGVELRFLLDGLRTLVGSRGILVIVGAEKVPREVYELADLNVAVTHLPHSEVAALAVFLHDLLGYGESAARGSSILPQLRGKLSLPGALRPPGSSGRSS
ncbi:tRNA (cytidine(56)-2'-O)-methyltransferase [Conexivisphaera calida]|uniref:tRNA (cytidine(56)-2'-O)-methyltransferase n=1 Tax=Conexivisphaera calida TaxID=1874277 RepID=UPI001E4DC72D|nr:tRNA (cytidine(56)-2'-O)-methyltransferase [Conexivisphaera calida]